MNRNVVSSVHCRIFVNPKMSFPEKAVEKHSVVPTCRDYPCHTSLQYSFNFYTLLGTSGVPLATTPKRQSLVCNFNNESLPVRNIRQAHPKGLQRNVFELVLCRHFCHEFIKQIICGILIAKLMYMSAKYVIREDLTLLPPSDARNDRQVVAGVHSPSGWTALLY